MDAGRGGCNRGGGGGSGDGRRKMCGYVPRKEKVNSRC